MAKDPYDPRLWEHDPLLSSFETADYLGVPRQTLAVWRARKPPAGPAFSRVGRYVRYRKSDIDRWLDTRRVEPDPAGDAPAGQGWRDRVQRLREKRVLS
jgi:predicted DNA-binding transcriptional regulator AlpA